ncbi:unnamed protein product [Lymnaea stagnalis]|uniref:Torsin-1A-interacting protein 1/2 AAA+ activator domain-containing protein n=1 Tax=Lymnaea stagnalis TaxID=6523 RepID=A0AAV2IPQ1_LYMST
MPRKTSKPQQNEHDSESESDGNLYEETVSNYDLRNRRERLASPLLKHKSPVPGHVSNTSLLSDSSTLDEPDKSPNYSRGSRSSSDGYGSPNRNSPNTGSPERIYPLLPTNQNPGFRSSPDIYPNLDESLHNLSRESEAGNESRSLDASDSDKTVRCRNLNDNNSGDTWRKESFINPDHHNQENYSSSNSIIIIIISIFFVVILLYFGSSNTSTTEPPTNVSPYESFITNIDSLEKMFPNQSKRFWNTFKASSRHILDDPNSDYPSVILMASQTYNGHIASCIAKLITQKFESVKPSKLAEFTVADIDLFKMLSSGEQKKKLDEKLTETFRQHKSVILDNLQSLSPEAALLLHGYCDNDNAPYKDVMMVLILHVDPNALKLDPDGTNSVEKYLQALWTQGLHEDKVAALLSRVANNVVVINAEDDKTVSKACADLRL